MASRSTRSVTCSCTTAEPRTPGRRPTSLRTMAVSTTSRTRSMTMPIRCTPPSWTTTEQVLALGRGLGQPDRRGETDQREDPARGTAPPRGRRCARSWTAGTPPAARSRRAAGPPDARVRPPAPAVPRRRRRPPWSRSTTGTEASTPWAWARPATSRISETRPSPMIVAPAYIDRPLSCRPIGLTTISWVSWTSTHGEAEADVVGLEHHDGQRLRVGRLGVQRAGQGHQGQQVTAQAQHRRAGHHLRPRGPGPRPRAGPARPGWPAGWRSVSAPSPTSSAGMIARVSGIRTRHVVPRPRWLDRSTEPPIRSMLVRTTSMPTPRPETLVTSAAVENPGWKISVLDLADAPSGAAGRR